MKKELELQKQDTRTPLEKVIEERARRLESVSMHGFSFAELPKTIVKINGQTNLVYENMITAIGHITKQKYSILFG